MKTSFCAAAGVVAAGLSSAAAQTTPVTAQVRLDSDRCLARDDRLGCVMVALLAFVIVVKHSCGQLRPAVVVCVCFYVCGLTGDDLNQPCTGYTVELLYIRARKMIGALPIRLTFGCLSRVILLCAIVAEYSWDANAQQALRGRMLVMSVCARASGVKSIILQIRPVVSSALLVIEIEHSRATKHDTDCTYA